MCAAGGGLNDGSGCQGIWCLPESSAQTFPGTARALSSIIGELFINNVLVRNHFIIVMIRWTGLAPWGFPFTGGLMNSLFQVALYLPS